MQELLRTIDPERPVLIAGPTASGKSALAMEIAERQGGVILNADALQVYACWRILSARPSIEEEMRVPHRLFGHIAADAPYSVGAWLRDVVPHMSGARPILVGGTGLYFTRLTCGLVEMPVVPASIRQESLAREPAELAAELDPETAGQIDTANPARVRRAWEVLRATGRGLIQWHRATPSPLLPREQAQAFVIEVDRDDLHRRIVQRADRMLAEGAIEEVNDVLSQFGRLVPAMKALGANEIADHITDHIPLETIRQQLIIATRQYAKRQRTWLRNNMQDWVALSHS